MSGDSCKTKTLNDVTVQENGIIRNSKGIIIGSTVDDVDFDSEHLEDSTTPKGYVTIEK